MGIQKKEILVYCCLYTTYIADIKFANWSGKKYFLFGLPNCNIIFDRLYSRCAHDYFETVRISFIVLKLYALILLVGLVIALLNYIEIS